MESSLQTEAELATLPAGPAGTPGRGVPRAPANRPASASSDRGPPTRPPPSARRLLSPNPCRIPGRHWSAPGRWIGKASDRPIPFRAVHALDLRYRWRPEHVLAQPQCCRRDVEGNRRRRWCANSSVSWRRRVRGARALTRRPDRAYSPHGPRGGPPIGNRSKWMRCVQYLRRHSRRTAGWSHRRAHVRFGHHRLTSESRRRSPADEVLAMTTFEPTRRPRSGPPSPRPGAPAWRWIPDLRSRRDAVAPAAQHQPAPLAIGGWR
jgi:hypothetical protein